MSSQQLRIQMSGGGPFGFRLLGGDSNPLSVSKIRPASKAQVAGLLEGDVILAMNNINCQGLSHSAANGLMESSSSGLTLLILRGKDAISDAPSTMASLGTEVQRLNETEANSFAQRHSNQIQTASDQYVTNGVQSEGPFRLSAPPSGESLKQIRISRRESRSGELQAPQIVFQSAENPNYYTREERTSTDGGKTTRIVEEVKTEKFGDTTLTKVTKQEFTSYSSSDPPKYSIIRSEEQGHPVNLGASTFETGILKNDGHLQDERGWAMTSNVERRSVKTQPYETEFRVTQEPLRNLVVYQDGIFHRNIPAQGEARNQPIPAIEIQFEPNERGFVDEVRATGVGQSIANGDSNFKVQIGGEVSFQPKVQIHSMTQSQYDFRPAGFSWSFDQPRVEAELKPASNLSREHRQPRNIYDTDIQSSRKDLSDYRTGVQSQVNTNPSSIYQTDFNPSHNYNREFDYNTKQTQAAYKLEPHGSERLNDFQIQNGPEELVEYRAVVHSPKSYNVVPKNDNEAPLSLNRNAGPRRPTGTEDQYGYNESRQQQSDQPDNFSQTDYHKHDVGARHSFGQRIYTEPEVRFHQDHVSVSQHRDAAPMHHDFRPKPVSEVTGRFDLRQKLCNEEINHPQRASTLQKAPHQQSKKVSWKQTAAPERAIIDSGSQIPHLPIERYDTGEATNDFYPTSTGKPKLHQMDRAERVEIGATPKWIPGSKLIANQSSNIYEPRDPMVNNIKKFGLNSLESQEIVGDGRYQQSTGDGWYEAPAFGAKNLPNVALSKLFDPQKQTNESRQFPRNSFDECNSISHVPQGNPEEDYSYEQQSEWSGYGTSLGQSRQVADGRQQSLKNAWKPSNEFQSNTFPHKFIDRNQFDAGYDQYDIKSDQHNQPVPAVAPPPPAPPLVPMIMTGPPSSVPPTFSQTREPIAPPPPAAPPIDRLKVYRGNTASDKGYGFTTLEERVKVANSVALSVLAPENKNSKGQKMFLRRRENAHKWTTLGPDPVPEKVTQRPQESTRNTTWMPKNAEQARLPYHPSAPIPHADAYRDNPGRLEEANFSNTGSSAYSLTDDMAVNSGKGGLLFAKRRAKSEKWASHESTGSQPTVFNQQGGYGAIKQFNQNTNTSSFGPSNWKQPQQTPTQPHILQGQPRGAVSSSPRPTLIGRASDVGITSGPQSYRAVRFQGVPAFSSSPSAPSAGHTQSTTYQGAKFAPKQFGHKATVSQSTGYTDL